MAQSIKLSSYIKGEQDNLSSSVYNAAPDDITSLMTWAKAITNRSLWYHTQHRDLSARGSHLLITGLEKEHWASSCTQRACSGHLHLPTETAIMLILYLELEAKARYLCLLLSIKLLGNLSWSPGAQQASV
jgi:hypothetical protein